MIDFYKEVKECVYKEELYSVRDNGAVMRHLREGKKPRKDDGVWTFGRKNSHNGYMMIGQHRVHIIVATAFLGARDTKVYVVDHIDTNRCNNRIENLRWFIRLENALCNEITRNKIIYICGSIEAFIENPSLLRNHFTGEPSLEWMSTVTQEEAAMAYVNTKQYWEKQAKNPRPLIGGKMNSNVYRKRQIEEMKPKQISPYPIEETQLVQAKSPNTAWQKGWKTSTVFLSCPSKVGENTIEEYFNNLVIGGDYSSTLYYGKDKPVVQKIVDKAYIDNNMSILVFSVNEAGVKPFALSKIYIYDDKIIHENIGTFFKEIGARKQFILVQGLEWTGGDSIDEYC